MKKSRLVKLAILLLTIFTLSGCLWVVEDEGGGHGGGHHGGHHGDHR